MSRETVRELSTALESARGGALTGQLDQCLTLTNPIVNCLPTQYTWHGNICCAATIQIDCIPSVPKCFNGA